MGANTPASNTSVLTSARNVTVNTQRLKILWGVPSDQSMPHQLYAMAIELMRNVFITVAQAIPATISVAR